MLRLDALYLLPNVSSPSPSMQSCLHLLANELTPSSQGALENRRENQISRKPWKHVATTGICCPHTNAHATGSEAECEAVFHDDRSPRRMASLWRPSRCVGGGRWPASNRSGPSWASASATTPETPSLRPRHRR